MLVAGKEQTTGIVTIVFNSFQPKVILLNINDGGSRTPPKTTELVELMVEISRFEAG